MIAQPSIPTIDFTMSTQHNYIAIDKADKEPFAQGYDNAMWKAKVQGSGTIVSNHFIHFNIT
jgi:hypothetical protein